MKHLIVGKRIKEERIKRNWTQEQFAEVLNVSRSTISSWEVNRNYPDLKTLVAISELFEISLDLLVKGDDKMIEKLSQDTRTKKVQRKKIQWLSIGIIILIVTLLLFIISNPSIQGQDIKYREQVDEINITDDGRILINLDLPFYRSVSGYAEYPDDNNQNIMNVSIESKVDVLLNNNENIEIKPYTYSNLEKINVLNNLGEIIKSYTVK